jgi:hypothetical protein
MRSAMAAFDFPPAIALMKLGVSGSGQHVGGTIYTALALDRCRRCPIGLAVDQHERGSRQGRLSSRYRSAQRQIQRPGAHSHDGESLES